MLRNIFTGDKVIFGDKTESVVTRVLFSRTLQQYTLWFGTRSYVYNLNGKVLNYENSSRNIIKVIPDKRVYMNPEYGIYDGNDEFLVWDKEGYLHICVVDDGMFIDEDGEVLPREETTKWAYRKKVEMVLNLYEKNGGKF